MGSGENEARAQELAQMRPMLLRIARLQLRNESWAEDTVSETILAAVEGYRRYEGRSRFRTWVVGILKHKIIDQFRRNRGEVSLDAERELSDGDTMESLFREDGHRAEAAADWGDPEAALARGEFFSVLEACVEQLPAPLARIFLLREWLGCETAEICKEMRVTSTHCFVMLYRARMRLRECLEVRWFAGERVGPNG